MQKTELFKSKLEKANHILITTHLYPDADGIGSQIALCMALRKLGKKAYCVNEEDLLDRYRYLDPDRCVISYQEFKEKHSDFHIDLFVVTDTNSLNRIGAQTQKLAGSAKSLIYIDHHPAPREIQALHCIDTSMSATGELVGSIIESLDIKFDQAISLPLFTAILIDTSCFRYPTVTGDTHRLVGKLLDAGVYSPEAYNQIYGTKKISYMQLLGRVLSSAKSTETGEVAWLSLKENSLEHFDVDKEDTHGFVNHLLILDNIKVAMMFWQIADQVKISFRSTGDVDVGLMAQALGGGGHNHSAATIIQGDIETVISETIPKVEQMLKKNGN